MSQTPPTNARTLCQASARLRRILVVAAVLLVVGEALWCLIGGARGAVDRPLGTLPAAAAATTLLLAVGLLGGRALGCDTRVIGVSLIVAILVGMFAEATVLAQARILAVEPKSRDSVGRT